MFDAILRLGAEKGVVTLDDVAARLAISADLAERLFFELERRGYLKNLSACHAPCGHCPAKEACRALREPRLWTFTEKGAQACRRQEEADERAQDARAGDDRGG